MMMRSGKFQNSIFRVGVCVVAMAVASGVADAQRVLYVSPDGLDENPGTQVAPFATLEKARDVLREETGRTAGAAPLPADWQGATIILKGGVYRLSQTFLLDERDSGTEGAPVVYRAAEGETVRISGGRLIPRSAWKQVLMPLLETRIPPQSVDKIYRLNLRDVQFKSLGDLSEPGDFSGLVAGGILRPPVRWPDTGWLRITKAADSESFIVESERVAGWENVGRRWTLGFWGDDAPPKWKEIDSVDRATRRLRLKTALPTTVSGDARGVQAYNILEELDAPGEWWYDAELAQLLFLPEREEDLADAELAILDVVVRVAGSDWVTFEDLDIEVSRGSGISVVEATGVEINRVNISHIGNWGVTVDGGRGVVLRQIAVTDAGGGGIRLAGGDRTTLAAAGHLVEHCTVSRYARLHRDGMAGIRVEGVGNTVRATTVSDGSWEAVFVSGNDQLVEDCQFTGLASEVGWMSVVHVDSGWAGRGNTIRGCRFDPLVTESIPDWVAADGIINSAITLERGSSGTIITDNTFKGSPVGIRINGGRDNLISGNTFAGVDRPLLLDVVDADTVAALQAELNALPTGSEPWVSRYPGLAGIPGNTPSAPVGTTIENNRNLDRSVLVDAVPAARDFVPLADSNLDASGNAAELTQLLAYDVSDASTTFPPGSLVFYVSESGKDSNDGSRDSPFRSLSRARDAIREATGRQNGAKPLGEEWRGAYVIIRGGLYTNQSGGREPLLFLDERDSGIEGFPVQYLAEQGEVPVISGAYKVDDSNWSKLDISDSFAWARIREDLRGFVYVLDLANLPIDLGVLNGSFSGVENMMLLIDDGNLVSMSAWPKGDIKEASAWVTISDAVDRGMHQRADFKIQDKRPLEWNVSGQDILAWGAWGESWALYWENIDFAGWDSGVKLSIPSRNGVYPLKAGAERYIRFVNVMEELDFGSYCLNLSRRKLYYAPANKGAPDGVRLTHLPVVMEVGVDGSSERAADWVVFRGIIFEGTRNKMIKAYRSVGLVYEDCQFGDCSGSGPYLKQVERSKFVDCTFEDIMQVGADFASIGDKFRLRESGCVVDGCVFRRVSWGLHDQNKAALLVSQDGCGMDVRNCLFEDNYTRGVLFDSAMVRVENNTFDRCVSIMGDAGAVSDGRKLTDVGCRISGNVFKNIIRHPLANRSTGAIFGVYLDDCMSWTEVSDNYFENCDNGIQVASGKGVSIQRNVFVGCSSGHHLAPILVSSRQAFPISDALLADINRFPVDQEPWVSLYPEIKDFRSEGVLANYLKVPYELVIADNVSRDGAYIARVHAGIEGHVDMSQKQYPIGYLGDPVSGFGTVPLSMSRRN